MIEKLHSLKEAYYELEKQMADPAVLADQKKYAAIAKRHSDLVKIVEKFNEYLNFEKSKIESQEIISADEDPELVELASEEIAECKSQMTSLEKELKILLLPKDPNDEKNTIVEIRAGTGGDEAGLFCADLYRMYTRFAELMKWKIEILTINETGVGGMKEVIFLISGKDVYSSLKYEAGVHRVQRVPETETQGRVHTSAATVAILPEMGEFDFKIDMSEVKFDVYLSSGPGGQSVNTTDSAVRATHTPTGTVATCQDEKSQHKNKAKALKILTARIAKLEEEKLNRERASERKNMVGSGDRSERIRTYNFPQNRMTDHRIGLTLHKLQAVMMGDLQETVSSLRNHFQLEELNNLEA